MTQQGSVTGWLEAAREGDAAAFEQLWDRYFENLTQLARTRLRNTSRVTLAGDDAALSALHSFWQVLQIPDRLQDVKDRNSLSALLRTMTKQKVIDYIRRENSAKRGGDRQREEFESVSIEPTAEVIAMLTDELERLFAVVGDDELREVLDMKLAGFTNQEIAAKQHCVERTIERRVATIRQAIEKRF